MDGGVFLTHVCRRSEPRTKKTSLVRGSYLSPTPIPKDVTGITDDYCQCCQLRKIIVSSFSFLKSAARLDDIQGQVRRCGLDEAECDCQGMICILGRALCEASPILELARGFVS